MSARPRVTLRPRPAKVILLESKVKTRFPSEAGAFCPEGCRCRGCGASLVVRLPDGTLHCCGCHGPAWPDRLSYWKTITQLRGQFLVKAVTPTREPAGGTI